MKLVSALAVIVATAAHSQSIYDLFGTDQFHRAYFEAKTNEITFEPFLEISWEDQARVALPWLNLDKPTPAQIARLSSFESAGPQFRSVDFRARLDSAASRASCLLIYTTGITSLQPDHLKGTVGFDFDTTMTIVRRRVVSGVIAGKPSRPVKTAAFVIAGSIADVQQVHSGATFAKRKQAGPSAYVFTDGSRLLTWTTSSKGQPDAASAVSFRIAGKRLLLVKWNSDFCGSAYTLFAADTALKPVAGNVYDCDP